MKDLESVVDKLGKEKADLEKVRAAESLKHTEEMNRLRKSPFGTRKCLEQIKDSGIEIPQETIDTFAEQEEHYDREATRLEVKEIPVEDLRLSPLVLESRFLIEDIWRQINPFGSNVDLIDSEAAIALRTPYVDLNPDSEDRMKELAQTAGSSTQRTDQDVDPTKQTSAGAVVPKDGVVPTIVLTDSPAKASKMRARPHLPLNIPRRKTVFLRVVQKRCLRLTRIRQPQHLVVSRVPEREMAAAARILLLSMSETRCLL
ncbi:hypothetical protein DY000_02030773 [Brassica cretica]|uniref:Uncharacterized protein n=1 Tax=Brassica cretica TaxID=69181 RepID=A0ABQ7DRV0_BRACR|nr:hypothetical protein DY000_02030773 [Brassica cretica]